MLKRTFLTSLFLLAFILPLAAQEKDSTDVWEDWGDEDNTECTSGHGRDYGFMQFHSFGGKPTIELTYGNSNVGMKSFGKLSQKRGFASVGSAELRLSYSSLEDYEDYIVRYRNRFFFVSNNSTDLISKTGTSSDISSNLWRFGFGTQDGYGYKIGKSAIVPYTSNSFVWSRVEWNLPEGGIPGLTAEDQTRLDLFNNAFRFGSMSEGGIKLQVVPLFTLNAGYEKSVIFPRYLVWKQLGSFIIEAAALGAADMFAGEVMDSSPAAGPIINFLLKNGVSYAIYQLRREKMNWPFNSAEPLTYDTWKIGMTFTF